jgi:hypothetical protein
LKSTTTCKVLGVLIGLGPQLACTSDPNTTYNYQSGDQACQDWKHSMELGWVQSYVEVASNSKDWPQTNDARRRSKNALGFFT